MNQRLKNESADVDQKSLREWTTWMYRRKWNDDKNSGYPYNSMLNLALVTMMVDQYYAK